MPTTEKLQKLLANLGLGSRREIEGWIEEGRVTVNNEMAHVGQRVLPNAKIRVDGRLVKTNVEPAQTRVLIYHKPAGEVCTRSDPEGRPTVFERLPKLKNSRWISVGRLDINSSGLLLFTNDGELANQLMHPKQLIEREYAVRVLGTAEQDTLKKLTRGVKLDDGLARFEHIVDSGGTGVNHWYHVVVMEGRNRLVRRLWESQGHAVNRLIRVRYGPVVLPDSLSQGRFVELKAVMVARLRDMEE